MLKQNKRFVIEEINMKPYKIFPSEKKTVKDRVSGAEVTQLTSYLGHSHHSYFTNNGWYDNNRKLLFTSDRDNARNLFSIDIESGEISQLTDFRPGMKICRVLPMM